VIWGLCITGRREIQVAFKIIVHTIKNTYFRDKIAEEKINLNRYNREKYFVYWINMTHNINMKQNINMTHNINMTEY
jgi:wobble nucleotide-excising tRNase